MAHPFETRVFNLQGEADCRSAALLLIGRSAWFEVTPLPDDQWMLETTPENSEVAALFDARVEKVHACPGCS